VIGVPFRRLWTPAPQQREGSESTSVSPEDLQVALDNDEFRVHYQPEVVLSSGTVVGVEALVRWSHPTRGLLAPAAFIPQLEASRLLIPFGRWVLHEACLALARMQVGTSPVAAASTVAMRPWWARYHCSNPAVRPPSSVAGNWDGTQGHTCRL